MSVDVSPKVTPTEQLRSRLDDPEVAAALNQLLDHSDLLAFALEAVDGLLRRSEEIGGSVLEGLADVRTMAESTGQLDALKELKPADIASGIVTFSTALPKVVPAAMQVIDSGILDAPVVDEIAKIGRGVAVGAEKAAVDPIVVKGPLALVKALKDPDIQQALGYALCVAKQIGAELGRK